MTKALQPDALRGSVFVSESPSRGGLSEGTKILTLDGAIPVEFLSTGDRVITRNGMRRLKSVTVENTSSALYRVAPSALGDGRPEEEILIPRGQDILVRDWQAQMLYGQDQAMVPIERLADGAYISRADDMAPCRAYHLYFDTDEVIYANGIETVATKQA